MPLGWQFIYIRPIRGSTYRRTSWAESRLPIFYRAAIRNSQKSVGEIPQPVQILFAFACTGTTTILWELYENFMDRFFGFQMVRGLEDTIMDLLMGLSGALVLSLFYKQQ